jgi:Ca2+-binding RTX toxin-like protein
MRRAILLVATVALTLLVASGVALAVNKVGTNGHDVLKGTDGDDNLLGLGGQDDIFGKDGSDNLVGGPGKDNVIGGDERRPGRGDKNLVGGPGNDAVFGGKGSDNMVGGEGNDLLFECCLREFSKDTLSGGSGNDVIDVSHRPAVRDVVVCGRGFDRVLADRKDTVARDCERVVVVRGSREAVLRQVDEFFESVPESFFRGLPPDPFR